MKRGDVVIVEVFFSDRSGSKVRPALVVRCDFLNQRLSDTIVEIVTSSPRRFSESGTQLRVHPTSEAGKSSGLAPRFGRAMRKPGDNRRFLDSLYNRPTSRRAYDGD